MPPFVAMSLSLPCNARFLLALRVSHERNLPPTLYLAAKGRYSRSRIEWNEVQQTWERWPMGQDYRTELDAILEMGYQFYLDAMCSKCGVPMWYGQSSDSAIQFEVEESICYGCQHLESTRDAKGKKKTKHGVTELVKPVGVFYPETGFKVDLPSPFEAMKSVGGD